MSPITFAAAMLATLPAVNALGNAIVKNQCSYPVYLWSIASGDWSPPMQTVAPGASYSEQYKIPPTGGISIKIGRTQDQYGPITQYEYTVAGTFWYDISNINGYPFVDSGVDLIPADSACPQKLCPAGVEQCTSAYNVPDDNHATAMCGPEVDTTMVLCSDAPSAPAAPAAPAAPVVNEAANVQNVQAEAAAPAPAAVTPAPAPPARDAANAPAPAYTTFVTQMVTAYVDADGNGVPDMVARAAATPAPAAEKRHEDLHMHKRAAHRHHFHRHAADSN